MVRKASTGRPNAERADWLAHYGLGVECRRSVPDGLGMVMWAGRPWRGDVDDEVVASSGRPVSGVSPTRTLVMTQIAVQLISLAH